MLRLAELRASYVEFQRDGLAAHYAGDLKRLERTIYGERAIIQEQRQIIYELKAVAATGAMDLTAARAAPVSHKPLSLDPISKQTAIDTYAPRAA